MEGTWRRAAALVDPTCQAQEFSSLWRPLRLCEHNVMVRGGSSEMEFVVLFFGGAFLK